MRSLSKVFTPLGIESCGSLHEYIDYYLGSYHGGRNESFIYGVVKGVFYDYDLSGAYPTGMSLIDYADWNRQIIIPQMSSDDFMSKYKDYLVQSYTSVKVKLNFPDGVMYPNLPVRLDKGSIIYPLSGQSFCTGMELLLAYKLGCKFTVLGGYFIPFLNVDTKDLYKDIISERRILESKLKENIVVVKEDLLSDGLNARENKTKYVQRGVFYHYHS